MSHPAFTDRETQRAIEQLVFFRKRALHKFDVLFLYACRQRLPYALDNGVSQDQPRVRAKQREQGRVHDGTPQHLRRKRLDALVHAQKRPAGFEHGKVEVTLEFAKRAQKKAERMVTFAKKGDLASRRQAARFVREEGFIEEKTKKNALQYLFDVLGPRYKDRNGGYTRILKTDSRRGDNAQMAILAFVD